MQRGRYYLGRVKKHGVLDNTKLLEAIINAPTLNIGKFAWTITDVEDQRDFEIPYIFGFLSKFSYEGHVTVVDEETKSSIEAIAPNLLIARTPFVYLLNFSGIAYMHAWNGISEEIFPSRFKKIINAAHGNFFVDCEIEAIADYRAFSSKLEKLEAISEIQAKVHPPNPLFGRLWGSLNDYISERNASEVFVKENSQKEAGLKTKILQLMQRILEDPNYEPNLPPSISDAAVLMAADGYGRGRVSGTQNGEVVVIRTSETQKSFLFSKTPVSEQLALQAHKYFLAINKERDMRH